MEKENKKRQRTKNGPPICETVDNVPQDTLNTALDP